MGVNSMMLESAINIAAKWCGMTPEAMRGYIVQTTGFMHGIGNKAIEADKKLDLILRQNETMMTQLTVLQATVERIAGGSVTLTDDALLLQFPPGTGAAITRRTEG